MRPLTTITAAVISIPPMRNRPSLVVEEFGTSPLSAADRTTRATKIKPAKMIRSPADDCPIRKTMRISQVAITEEAIRP